ncbi:MAG TPA: alpha/beta fold hydrolase [Mycobacterium sp.]|nr:alpha/beta fold hydrolase [Mycobacterium sp.]
MPEDHGTQAAAVRARETSLTARLQAASHTDQVLTAAVCEMADHARAGRRRLDAIGTEIRDAVAAAQTLALDTPAGARQFQVFLAAKALDIRQVVADAVADSSAASALLWATGAGYRIPARLRDRVNRQVLADDIARVEHATEAISAAEMVRYDNALRVRDGLRLNSGHGGAPVLLLSYDPAAFDGRGRAAIAIGDPDTADNTTVLVPGARSSVRAGYLSSPDGGNVYREVMRADPDRTNSVIMWMGYQTPDNLVDPQVAQPASARVGGRLLAADINALRRTHTGASHVTVIGHSYGSTTVADAAAGFRMHADDVVLVGSPGTDLARSATDFHLPATGHVYVGAASTDPITGLSGEPQLRVPGTAATVGLGADPAADGYGSTRFKAEIPVLTSPMDAHSSYFRPDSEALFSIGDIASGHGDALAHDHMTAPHRHRLPTFDPERLRPARGGHRH